MSTKTVKTATEKSFDEIWEMTLADARAENKTHVTRSLKRKFESAYDFVQDVMYQAEQNRNKELLKLNNLNTSKLVELAFEIKAQQEALVVLEQHYKTLFGAEAKIER